MGRYERALQRVFRRFVRPGSAAYDLGAHVGFHTLLLAHLVGPTGSVIAVEPDVRNAAYLRRHKALNHLDHVTVIEAAVADRPGTCTFVAAEDLQIPGRRDLEWRFDGHLDPERDGRSVPVVSLDDLVFVHHYPAPDLVKVDIEGAEVLMLHGAPRLIETHHPTWVLAYHDEAKGDACESLLRKAGYSAWRLPDKTDVIVAIARCR